MCVCWEGQNVRLPVLPPAGPLCPAVRWFLLLPSRRYVAWALGSPKTALFSGFAARFLSTSFFQVLCTIFDMYQACQSQGRPVLRLCLDDRSRAGRHARKTLAGLRRAAMAEVSRSTGTVDHGRCGLVWELDMDQLKLVIVD